MTKVWVRAGMGVWALGVMGLAVALVAGAGAQKKAGPVVNPANNPLLGSWVYSSGGFGGAKSCSKTRTFAAHSQTFEAFGKVQKRDATYAVEAGKVYVQDHPGSGGTTAYAIVSKNEIMDTLGTGACHWKRQ